MMTEFETRLLEEVSLLREAFIDIASAINEAKAKRPKAKKDELTVTGKVTAFGLKMQDGKPKRTKTGNQMWFLVIDGKFRASIFDEMVAAVLSKAVASNATVIVTYTRSGNYNNIESVELGAELPKPEPSAVDDDEVPF